MKLPEAFLSEQVILRAAANGFILTAMLWGALLADLLEGRLRRASLYGFICALFSLFGIIHSVSSAGDVYLPWHVGSALPWQISLGYGAIALFFYAASRQGRSR